MDSEFNIIECRNSIIGIIFPYKYAIGEEYEDEDIRETFKFKGKIYGLDLSSLNREKFGYALSVKNMEGCIFRYWASDSEGWSIIINPRED
jgi:hypothetical protein